MKDKIQQYLDNPKAVEKLYQEDKKSFKHAFMELYPDIQEMPLAVFWHERLTYEQPAISWGRKGELWFIVIASLLAGVLAKLPEFTPITEDEYYIRNFSFIVFPFLMAYFAWKRNLSLKNIGITVGITLTALIFINVLPNESPSEYETKDTFILACLYLPFLLWSVLGFTFTGNDNSTPNKRLDFLRYNGEVVIMTSIILLAGGILTGLTLALFKAINIIIVDFYIEYIALTGFVASPIVGTYIVQSNPALINKVSSVIAQVFSPLVLITLFVYLLVIIAAGENPFSDREFLLTLNIVLISVIAIIFFALVESTKDRSNNFMIITLSLLSIIAIVIDGIALSAIVFRITEWGMTPNRIAVLGSNALTFVHLVLIARKMLQVMRKREQELSIEKSIVNFLPIYSAWAAFMVFIVPFLF